MPNWLPQNRTTRLYPSPCKAGCTAYWPMLSVTFPCRKPVRPTKVFLLPGSTRQEQAYRQILDNLKTANSLFDTESGLVYNTSGDMLYSTTDGEGIKKWQKFCNSLRMRTLTRLLDAEGFNAQAELQEMYNNPATYPVFESD